MRESHARHATFFKMRKRTTARPISRIKRTNPYTGKESNPLTDWHADIYGPIATASLFGNHRYVLSFIDRNTKTIINAFHPTLKHTMESLNDPSKRSHHPHERCFTPPTSTNTCGLKPTHTQRTYMTSCHIPATPTTSHHMKSEQGTNLARKTFIPSALDAGHGLHNETKMTPNPHPEFTLATTLFEDCYDDEIGYFLRNKVLLPITREQLQPDDYIHRTTALYTPKFNDKGIAYKGKLRLVFSSKHQVKGQHYLYKSSHSPKWPAILLHNAIQPTNPTSIITTIIDIKKAYIQATPMEPPNRQRTIINLPRDLRQYDSHGQPFLYILTKPLYGQVDAGLQWQRTLFQYLKSQQWQQSITEPTIFTRKNTTEKHTDNARIIIHTDDIHIRATATETKLILTQLNTRFPGITTNTSNWYLGHEFTRHPDGSHSISSSRKILSALQRFNLQDANTKQIPITPKTPTKEIPPTSNDPTDKTEYQQLQGTLNYIAMTTRPDISYAVSQTSQAQQQPTVFHSNLQKRILKYLKGTTTLKIHYKISTSPTTNTLIAFADASFQSNTQSRSHTGWIIFFNGAPIAWSSSIQKTIASSTQEAEIIACHSCIKTIIYLRNLLYDLGYPQQHPTQLFCDNTAAIEYYETGLRTKRNQHIDRNIHHLQQQAANKSIILKHINSAANIADLLTKALPAPTFTKHLYNIINSTTLQQPTTNDNTKSKMNFPQQHRNTADAPTFSDMRDQILSWNS
eukprot:m.306915 g.306915  ORF g.306915 m.306915 type:complete len:742 (-) comp20191_c1_seq64:343-2568(-)